MKKAFSLFEVLLAIMVIAALSSFLITKFDKINTNTNLTKVKSDFAIIQYSIGKYKNKNVLLSKDTELTSLDNAKFDTKDEKLFTMIFDNGLLSTNSEEKELGKWRKISNSTYEFFLLSNKKVLFSLEDNNFICKSPKKICGDFQ